MGKYSKLLKEILEEKCNNNYEKLFKAILAESLDSCNSSLELTGEDEDYIIDRAYSVWIEREDYQFDDAMNEILYDINYVGGLEKYKEHEKNVKNAIEKALEGEE